MWDGIYVQTKKSFPNSRVREVQFLTDNMWSLSTLPLIFKVQLKVSKVSIHRPVFKVLFNVVY